MNQRAVDEVWYKRAVDQHGIEPESFVFSVPFDATSSIKPLVTATHAVFVEHKGHHAPAAVVGLQIQHASLASHFQNITSTVSMLSTILMAIVISSESQCSGEFLLLNFES
jgi:hypothetical protein